MHYRYLTRNVLPADEGGWMVLESGNLRFASREEAVEHAKRSLVNAGGGRLLMLDGRGRVKSEEVVERPDDPGRSSGRDAGGRQAGGWVRKERRGGDEAR